jgi:hypothetical protein
MNVFYHGRVADENAPIICPPPKVADISQPALALHDLAFRAMDCESPSSGSLWLGEGRSLVYSKFFECPVSYRLQA